RAIMRVAWWPGTRKLSCRLADTPEERHRGLDDSGDIRAPGLIQQDEAERRVDDVVEGSLVEAAHGHFLLVERARIKAGSDLGFDLSAARPAEERLVASGANGLVGRGVGTIDADMPVDERVPAARPGRFL